MYTRSQRVEDQRFGLVLVGVLLVFGLYMVGMVNYAFVSPQLIETVISKR